MRAVPQEIEPLVAGLGFSLSRQNKHTALQPAQDALLAGIIARSFLQNDFRPCEHIAPDKSRQTPIRARSPHGVVAFLGREPRPILDFPQNQLNHLAFETAGCLGLAGKEKAKLSLD